MRFTKRSTGLSDLQFYCIFIPFGLIAGFGSAALSAVVYFG